MKASEFLNINRIVCSERADFTDQETLDMKSSIDLESRLNRMQARKLLSELLSTNPNCFSYGSYFKRRLTERHMTMGDIINILHKGQILHDAEFEQDQWRYRIETAKMTVIISFVNPAHVRLITCWRGQQ